jgi:uncharacterized membrane protein (DUF373 family)
MVLWEKKFGISFANMNTAHIIALLKKFEHVVIIILICLLALVVLCSIGDLGLQIFKDLLTPPVFLLQFSQLSELFGYFLLILIGLELIESVKAYLVEGAVHTEIVLTVAIIALGRKIITLEAKEYNGFVLFGIGFILLALAIAYYLIKRPK